MNEGKPKRKEGTASGDQGMTRRVFLDRARKLFTGFAGAAAGLASGEAEAKQKREKPRQNQPISREMAVFDIFPEKLDFVPGRKILIVSAVWQTACLYDAEGKRLLIENENGIKEPFLVQVSTGRKSFETELGLYEIQTQNGPIYRSHELPVPNDGTTGALMPYAMHIGKVHVDQKGELYSDDHTGVAIHGSERSPDSKVKAFGSSKCIRFWDSLIKKLSETLKPREMKKRKVESNGDFVLVVGEEMPKVRNISELVNLKERETYVVPEKLHIDHPVEDWDGVTMRGINDKTAFERMILEGKIARGTDYNVWFEKIGKFLKKSL